MVIVCAYSAFTIVWLLAWQAIARQLIGIRFIHVMLDTMPFMLIAAAVMVTTYFITLSIANLWLLLLSRIAVAALLYYIIMRLLNVAIFKECMQFILKRKK
jgi:hypothetical protein